MSPLGPWLSDAHLIDYGTHKANVKHVEFREHVSRKNGYAHFLRDAAAGHTAEHVQILRSALRG